ncbi:uncharacterized protein LOC100901023, partial [Galendromus occidentalis]|uniref:Uncharacterized protein LOC100901023 n=1 Tax=Galendromus occidentalis TaxID=34638 RepID=A0AAJ7WH78_9ACAR
LELLAALIGVRLHEKIIHSSTLDFDGSTFHCDNAAVLGWCRSEADRWKPFVANRVSEIRSRTSPRDWKYIPSELNPADILSRGTPLSDPDTLSIWLSGPPFLTNPFPTDFEHILSNPSHPENLSEEKKIVALASTQIPPQMIIDAVRFSSWSKLVRSLASVIRFVNRTRKRAIETAPHVSSEEFAETQLRLFRNIQEVHFESELQNGLSNVSKTSRLFQLRPFIDDSGLIRCRSRLERSSELSFDQKCPIILPGSDPAVSLYILWVHCALCCHSGGVNLILHHLRTRVLILGARRLARSTIKGCKVCLKFNAKRAEEVTPPLPEFRIGSDAAFRIVGADFAGPISVKTEGNSKSKSYICLFVCSSTRAIHLELVPDLSCYQFLLALRRFFNRFPFIVKIISDNALTFKRAEKEIALIRSHIKSKCVQEALAKFDIRWEFITERSPWHGGWYERLVQTVKRPLRKVLGTNVPRFGELATILSDIENMVNQRPLTVVSLDPDEPEALTPMDLIFGKPARVILPDTRNNPISPTATGAAVLSARWRHQQSILNSFWRRFLREYLPYLRSAHWRKPVDPRPLRVGDLCLLEDPNPSRARWLLVRITALFGGRRTDSRPRSCFVKFPDGRIFKRPIQLLYPLEIQ